jgi:hypothetical protein
MNNTPHEEISDELRMFLKPLANVAPDNMAAIARFLAMELLKIQKQLQTIEKHVEEISSSMLPKNSSNQVLDSESSKP